MPELRQRGRGRETPATGSASADDTDTDGNMSDGRSNEAVAKPGGHSKGENKMSKMKKRLKFGSLLLVALCCIIAAGHLWTLFLVREKNRRSNAALRISSERC